MRESVERELKLVPGEDFVMPALGEPGPTRVFTSTYHDTVDLSLARAGITFRHRAEDGTRLWQLKLPHGAHRLELEMVGPPARAPEELRLLLVAHLRHGDLAPVARLRTRREVMRTRDAEILDDAVAVLEGQRIVRRFRELEVELVGDDPAALDRLGGVLRQAGAVASELRPKLFRALDLEVAAGPAVVTPQTPPLEALGLALAEQYRRLLAHDPGARHGSDPEDLHQLRVATRRLRAFLRTARPLVDREWADALRSELGWLGGELGPARDLDVLTERLRTELTEVGGVNGGAADLLAGLEAERAAARAAAVVALSTERYLALLDRVEATASPPAGEGGTTLAELWLREWRRTRRAFARLGRKPPDAELHAARIKVKRSRYAAELAAHELGRPGQRFVDAAKALQDVLGEHQDAVVAEERVLAWVAAGGDAVLGERLVEAERRRRVAARADWHGAWKLLERRAERAAG